MSILKTTEFYTGEFYVIYFNFLNVKLKTKVGLQTGHLKPKVPF